MSFSCYFNYKSGTPIHFRCLIKFYLYSLASPLQPSHKVTYCYRRHHIIILFYVICVLVKFNRHIVGIISQINELYCTLGWSPVWILYRMRLYSLISMYFKLLSYKFLSSFAKNINIPEIFGYLHKLLLPPCARN